MFFGQFDHAGVAGGAQPDGTAAKHLFFEALSRKMHETPWRVIHVQRERAFAATQSTLQAMTNSFAANRVADPARKFRIAIRFELDSALQIHTEPQFRAGAQTKACAAAGTNFASQRMSMFKMLETGQSRRADSTASSNLP